jgi:hypothetical protein
MYETWNRWAGILGLALTVVAVTPSPAAAATGADDDPHAETLDGRHFGHFHVGGRRASATRSWVLEPGRLAVCPVLPRSPLGTCPQAVRVRMPFRDDLPILDTRRYQMERNSNALLEAEIHEVARLRLLRTRIDTFYGVEDEPEEQFRLRREALVFLATLSADSRILTAARGICRR